MERNSTSAAGRLPGGINSAADKGVSAMILSYHDSVPPTFADKQVNAHGTAGLHRPQNRLLVGRVPSPGGPAGAMMRMLVRRWVELANQNGDVMGTVCRVSHLKDITADLHAQLKSEADANFRSLTQV